jgi:subtilisin family serine protease
VHRRSLRTTAALVTTLSLIIMSMGSALAVDGSDFTAQSLEPDGAPLHAAKSRSGGLAQTDPDLLGRTDATPLAVMVKLDYDAVASYAGDVAGLAATSPEVTGLSLDENQAAVDAYLDHLASEEAAAREAIAAGVPQATLLDSFQVAYGGVSAVIPANRVGDLLAVDGVVAVHEDSLEQPLTDVTPDFVGATQAWAQLGGSDRAGEGVIVGVLDTGIWPEHPSLADHGVLSHPGGTYGCDFGDGSDPDLGDPFTCNSKLVGAYSFVDTYLAFGPALLDGEFCAADRSACSARDANGHGTHTASTSAGGPVDEVVLLGVDRGPISGIAPGAHVIAYRVCLDAGCFQSDSVAAVEQAIVDGVDVINFSISGGNNAYTDPVELAFLDAYAAGILVNASAGNAGPGAGTANHAGPWTNTVGASTSNRHFLTTLHLTADGGASLDITGATVNDGLDGPADVVLAEEVPGYTDPLCLTPLPADSAVGQVVACERGVIARVDKSKHVEPSGAAGMILYNPVPQGLNTDNHFIPSVHIDQPDSDAFLAFVADQTGVQAEWSGGVATAVPGDVMASFSSRGPLGDFLKPDVTAPGVQILAGNSPVPVGDGAGVQGELYQAIQGTSMSSPHAAGVAALVRAAHPGWSPGQVKSALMTSSVQAVLKEDGTTAADPFDRGAGSIRADRAIGPTITFDVDADDYYASAADPLSRLHLNLPSVHANPMPGAVVTERTLRNVSGSRQSLQISTTASGGARISVTPNRVNLAAGESATLRITIDGTSAADGWHFGQITFRSGGSRGGTAVMPVAFNKTQGAVALEHSCDPTDLARRTAADCEVTAANFAPVPAEVSLDVRTSAQASRLEIANVGSPGVKTGNGFRWNGTLAPAMPPTIESVAPGSSPAGYLPLSAFGIAPVAGMGDESIANFNVPAFQYGGETYGRIGFTSNGYAVVGGGMAADVTYIPQDLPDPARPNNVLAPFWTDLNLAAGGAFRAGFLTDGVTTWLIGDWEAAPTWESAGAVTNSFQVWIALGATEDISFTFGPIGGPDGIGLTVGAENRDGSSGAMHATQPTAGTELVVTTSPPTAGGTVTIPYQAIGKVPGTYDIVATLTTNLMNASTREVVTIRVR